LAIAASRIAELEQTKAAAEAGLKEATTARIDACVARVSMFIEYQQNIFVIFISEPQLALDNSSPPLAYPTPVTAVTAVTVVIAVIIVLNRET
jgi:hypothetical protein